MDKDRKSFRLEPLNYVEQGAYFVTLCTEDRRRLFGEVMDGVMVPSSLGWIVDDEWRRIGEMREGIRLDEFTLMPDHFHGILIMEHDFSKEGPRGNPGVATRNRYSLGTILAGFKAAVTSRSRLVLEDPRGQIWQRNYYERSIRHAEELERIRQYIRRNPENWRNDRANEQVA